MLLADLKDAVSALAEGARELDTTNMAPGGSGTGNARTWSQEGVRGKVHSCCSQLHGQGVTACLCLTEHGKLITRPHAASDSQTGAAGGLCWSKGLMKDLADCST
jgi:hypothetical protein